MRILWNLFVFYVHEEHNSLKTFSTHCEGVFVVGDVGKRTGFCFFSVGGDTTMYACNRKH